MQQETLPLKHGTHILINVTSVSHIFRNQFYLNVYLIYTEAKSCLLSTNTYGNQKEYHLQRNNGNNNNNNSKN